VARRLPKSIRIASHRIGIGKAENLHHHDHNDGSVAKAYAVSDLDDLFIWLDDQLGPERQKVSLLHEVLHMGLGVARIDIDNEEEFVTKLAPMLFSFLRENKAAVAYLQEV
jgi:hypothetical protein